MTRSPTDEVTFSGSENSQKFRSEIGHISRHSGTYFAGTVLSVALGYAFKVYLARVLGPEALGIYALGMTFLGLLGPLTSLGLVESAVRFAAVYRSTSRWEELRSLLWRGGAILTGTTLVFSVVLLLAGGTIALRFYHSPTLAQYVPWFALLMFIGAVSTFYGRILAGYRQVARRTLITTFVGTPANMLLSIALISLGWGLKGYLFAQVLSGVFVVLLILILVWRLTPVEARLPSHGLGPLNSEVWSFSASAVGVLFLEFVIAQVDRVALGYFRGPREVGIYSIAAALVAYVSLLLSSVNQVFSPVIADLHTRKDMATLARLYKALTKWILGLTLPLAMTVMVFAVPILRIFGHDFQAGWPILIIGTIAQLVNCGVGSVGLLLLMSGHQKRLLHVQMIMATVMVFASVLFVPLWGAIGAAIAAAITNTGMNTLNLLEVRRLLGMSPFSRSYLRLVLPTAGAFAVCVFLNHRGYWFRNDWIAIGIGLVLSYITFAALTLSLGLDEDDRIVTGALWSRVRGSLGFAKGMAS